MGKHMLGCGWKYGFALMVGMAFAGFVCLGVAVPATSGELLLDTLVEHDMKDMMTPEDIRKEAGIIGLTLWRKGPEKYLVAVKQVFSENDVKKEFEMAEVRFFERSKTDLYWMRYTYRTTVQFGDFTNAGELSKIMLVHFNLVSASMYVGFRWSESGIGIVLHEYSKMPIEIVDLDNDGYSELIFSEDPLFIDMRTKRIVKYPVTAKILKWNGTKYTALKEVNWKKRLCARKMK